MEAKRKTIKPEPLQTLEEVNEVLGKLGIAEMELEAINNDAEQRIAAIKVETAEKMAEHREIKKNCEKQIADYLKANQAQFKVKRFIQLTFGKIGWRKSSGSIVTLAKWTWNKALESIEHSGSKEQKETWIERKVTLSKTQILKDYRAGKVNDKQLAKLGLAFDDSDNPYWEPDRTQLQNLAA